MPSFPRTFFSPTREQRREHRRGACKAPLTSSTYRAAYTHHITVTKGTASARRSGRHRGPPDECSTSRSSPMGTTARRSRAAGVPATTTTRRRDECTGAYLRENVTPQITHHQHLQGDIQTPRQEQNTQAGYLDKIGAQQRTDKRNSGRRARRANQVAAHAPRTYISIHTPVGA
ncbi:hypothetical protein BJ912DRAFT_1008995 [Pholiota molesta]|nr:hypothetical protein BJ912DRAFT_1008973 [Pholiota molesta]KAF8160078.1 hypothetical protein BJ912DRAFT_1008995 [Pholiota molesta]